MKHWIAVISLAHAQIAAKSNFLQVCHGKKAPLRATNAGDEVFIYCPKREICVSQSLKLIAFRGIFDDNHIYQVEQAPGFKPFRKDVTFDRDFQPIGIKDIVGLELTSCPNWGMLARRGFFEISPHDAHLFRTREGMLL